MYNLCLIWIFEPDPTSFNTMNQHMGYCLKTWLKQDKIEIKDVKKVSSTLKLYSYHFNYNVSNDINVIGIL